MLKYELLKLDWESRLSLAELWDPLGSCPDQLHSHNCYGEMSEILPGLYLGPEMAIETDDQASSLGAILVLSLNAPEEEFLIGKEQPSGLGLVSSADFTQVDEATFITELARYVDCLDGYYTGRGVMPKRTLFRRCIAADDNQFFDLSGVFEETTSLLSFVVRFRRRLEMQWSQSVTDESIAPKASRVQSSGPRSTTTVTSFSPTMDLFPPPSVAVHCLVGMSRSAAVVLAYLMRVTGAPCDTILASFMKVRRPIVQPNSGFTSQLKCWEKCGYASLKDAAGCESVVAGILKLRKVNGVFIPTALKDVQLGSLSSLVDVYVTGLKFSAERHRMGRVFWLLVRQDNCIVFEEILASVLGLLAQKTEGGVYVDCPGIFTGFLQIFIGIAHHAPETIINIHNALAEFVRRLDNQSLCPIKNTHVHDVVELGSLWESQLANRVRNDVEPLFRIGFITVASSLGVSTSVIKFCVHKYTEETYESASGGALGQLLLSEEHDDFDYAREPLWRYIHEAINLPM